MDAGYLEKESIQNKIIYKANTNHPLFSILQKIVRQHIGLDAMVEMILQRMGSIERVVIVGDYAKGIDSGTIKVVLVGNDLNSDYIEQLSFKIEKEIKRKVHFLITNKHDGLGLIIYEAT